MIRKPYLYKLIVIICNIILVITNLPPTALALRPPAARLSSAESIISELTDFEKSLSGPDILNYILKHLLSPEELKRDPTREKIRLLMRRFREFSESETQPLVSSADDRWQARLRILIKELVYIEGKKDLVDKIRQLHKKGLKKIFAAISGQPAAGKSTLTAELIKEIAEILEIPTAMVREDDYLIERSRRGKGLKGKFRWEWRNRNLIELSEGKNTLTPIFDDTSGGNLLLGLNEANEIVIYNGNNGSRTITVTEHSDGAFSYKEVFTAKGKPVDITAKRGDRNKHVREANFISGGTPIKLERTKQGLIITIRNTPHLVYRTGNQTLVTAQIPDEEKGEAKNGHLKDLLTFELQQGLKNAQPARNFIAASGLIVFEGHFAYWNLPKLKEQIYDIRANFRQGFPMRLVRDIQRNRFRGRTPEEVRENAVRFIDRQHIEETHTLPVSIDRWVEIQINTGSPAETIWRDIVYDEAKTPAHRETLREFGFGPETPEEVDDVAAKVIKGLIQEAKGTVFEAVPYGEGLEVVDLGPIRIVKSRGQNQLDPKYQQRFQRLRAYGNGILVGAQLVDMATFPPITVKRKDETVAEELNLGTVLVETGYVNTGLKPIEKALQEWKELGQEGFIAKCKWWLDDFVERELILLRRGIVDVNPDPFGGGRVLQFVHAIEHVVCSAPCDQLLTGGEALEAYNRDRYLTEGILRRIPPELQDYYCTLIMARLPATQMELYLNQFEQEIPLAERIKKQDLPQALQTYYTDIYFRPRPEERALRNWGVMNPFIWEAQIDFVSERVYKRTLEWLKDDFQKSLPAQGDIAPYLWLSFLRSFPDRHHIFYKLIGYFSEIMFEQPELLNNLSISELENIRKLIYERFVAPFKQAGVTVPEIKPFVWRLVNRLLLMTASFTKIANLSLNQSSDVVYVKSRSDAKELLRIAVEDEQDIAIVIAGPKREPPQLFATDFDGTLVADPIDPASFVSFYQKMTGESKEAAIAFREITKGAEVFDRVGKIRSRCIELKRPDAEQPIGWYMEQFYNNLCAGRTRELGNDPSDWRMPGALEYLERYSYQWHVVTARPISQVKRDLQLTGLAGVVKSVVSLKDSESDSGYPNKRAILEKLATDNGIATSRILYIDDNPQGIDDAKALGAFAIGVVSAASDKGKRFEYGVRLIDAGCDIVATSLEALTPQQTTPLERTAVPRTLTAIPNAAPTRPTYSPTEINSAA